ncbi:MAG: o-succinylbenzoate synthase [Bacteroidales bacterium]|nr:o-succinylbenzoate synthase [Bacteroidales bacterium]
MLKFDYIKIPLKFLQPAGTSRGVLHEKDSWFVRVTDPDNPELSGIGECSLIPGLSPDSISSFEQQLKAVCDTVENIVPGQKSAPGKVNHQEKSWTSSEKGRTLIDNDHATSEKDRTSLDKDRTPPEKYQQPPARSKPSDADRHRLNPKHSAHGKDSSWILKGSSLTAEELIGIDLSDYPAIRFGLETALRDLQQGGKRLLYPSDFTSGTTGIPINGLIWMSHKQEMLSRIAEKLDQGFKVLKMKVGALSFDDELEILRAVREEHPPSRLELRLDANGAWQPNEALDKLKVLSKFGIHSVEQPIAAGAPEAMARICINSPVPIALDEELIGVQAPEQKEQLLAAIKPHFIILKPSLLGGFAASEEWIGLAEKQGTGWWITSALESNIGLNAIAQWTTTLNTSLPQGLGTGSLFANNVPSPLTVTGSRLFYRPEKSWNLLSLKF